MLFPAALSLANGGARGGCAASNGTSTGTSRGNKGGTTISSKQSGEGIGGSDEAGSSSSSSSSSRSRSSVGGDDVGGQRSVRLANQVLAALVQLAPLAAPEDLMVLRRADEPRGEELPLQASVLSSPSSLSSVGRVLLGRGVLAHLVLGTPLPPQFTSVELGRCEGGL